MVVLYLNQITNNHAVPTVGATMLWPEHGLRAERGLTENGNLTAGRPGNLRSRTEVALASVLKKLTV